MAEKVYGVFEYSWEASKTRSDRLAEKKAWQALRDDGVEDIGFTTDKFTTDKFKAQEMASEIREWNSMKRSTSRVVQLGPYRRAVIVHLRDDGVEDIGFTTDKFTTDKFKAQEMASEIREWNSMKRSTSRVVQLGPYRRAVIVHECTVEGRTAYWKLSSKEYEAATQHPLYIRLKAENEHAKLAPQDPS